MCFNGNFGAAQNYEAVNAEGVRSLGLGHGEPALKVGDVARYDARGSEDDFTQAGNLYRLLPEAEKDRLTSNIAGAMRSVGKEIQERQLGHFTKADPDYGRRVGEKLKK